MLWSVFASIAEQQADAPGPRARASAMLKGAAKFLEAGHVQHLQATIQSNRPQVSCFPQNELLDLANRVTLQDV